MIKLFASGYGWYSTNQSREIHKNNIQAIRKSPKTRETLYRLYWS